VTARVLDTAGELRAGDWDALVGPDDLFLSTRWLRVVEATAGVGMGYLVAEAGAGSLVGGLATALADSSVPWLSGRPDGLLERAVREQLPGAVEVRSGLPADLTGALLPGLVCGGRHLGRTRVLMSGNDAEHGADIEALVAAAERLGVEREARSVAFLYVDERDRVLREVLTRRGYRSHVSGWYSWLPVPSGGLDDHLDALSAHRSRRIRAERRRLSAAGVRTAVEPLERSLIPRLAVLETQLLTKYGLRWSADRSAAIFEQILDTFGADAVVSTARVGAELAGFGLLLRHHDQWYAHRAGFDYALQRGLPLYFDVIYYQPIDDAARLGISTIHYGTGSAEAKRSRGCLAVGQYAYLRVLAEQPC
jgi:predicted N-acyltransferase